MDTKKPYSDADVAMYQQQVAFFINEPQRRDQQVPRRAGEHLDGEHALKRFNAPQAFTLN